MIFLYPAILFATSGLATPAESLLPRVVDCKSLGNVGNAAFSYCSSVLGISTLTILQSVTVGTISAGNPTVVHTLISTKSATKSIATITGTAVTHTQTKIITATETCHTSLQKRGKKSTSTNKSSTITSSTSRTTKKSTSTTHSTSSTTNKNTSIKSSTSITSSTMKSATSGKSSTSNTTRKSTLPSSSTSSKSSTSRRSSTASSSPSTCSTAIRGLKSFACQDLPSVCSCLGLTMATVSSTTTISFAAKTTAVKTSTVVEIVTGSIKGTTITLNPTQSLTVTHTSTISTCVPACVSPTPNLCSGSCVNLSTDPEHCGTCDNACPEGAYCAGLDGTCICPIDHDICEDGCIDISSDPSNCGKCGRECGEGASCSDGSCICPAGLTSCFLGCADLKSDPDNCGACGRFCNEGYDCCGGVCRDITSDSANCGACGHECLGYPDNCIASSCWCPSSLNLGFCDGACTDLTTLENCVTCGNVCDEQRGLFCYDTGCACDPDPEMRQMYCEDGDEERCVITIDNPAHCGSCGNACDPECELCQGTSCVSIC